MICHNLIGIAHLNEVALRCGSSMHELNHRGDLTISELDVINDGKEAGIRDMLAGGNGFPIGHYSTIMATAFDSGCTIERRDLRSLRLWERDLQQCLADRKKGAVS